jgi:hypothetical protein
MAEWISDLESPILDLSGAPLDLLSSLDDSLFMTAVGHILKPHEGNTMRLWDQGGKHQASDP